MASEFDHPLLREYGPVLKHVDRVPRTVTELHQRWTGIPFMKSLNRRRRNERKWLALYLEFAAREGKVIRGKTTDGEGRALTCIWRMDADDAAGDQPGSAAA